MVDWGKEGKNAITMGEFEPALRKVQVKEKGGYGQVEVKGEFRFWVFCRTRGCEFEELGGEWWQGLSLEEAEKVEREHIEKSSRENEGDWLVHMPAIRKILVVYPNLKKKEE